MTARNITWTAKSRFLDKFTSGHESGCWEWTASKCKSGYGWFKYQGRMLGAHRVSYMLFEGKIPEGKIICHLFLGTDKTNAEDRAWKGRNGRLIGEGNHKAKITRKQALEIRKAAGTQQSIADKYGITQAVVSKIKLRQLWA